MAPDAKHVENLASLLEVKGAKTSPTPSSRATGRGQRDVLRGLLLSRTRQVRSAVCDKGARPRHADAKHVVDAEAQTVCQVSPRCGRRGAVFSRTRMSQTRCWFGLMVTGVGML